MTPGEPWRSFVGQLQEYDGTNEERNGNWYVHWPRRLNDTGCYGSPKCHYAAVGWSP